ncbi:hypothetical protein chiPu_0016227 [Chiloscyllium punctatum]|uniref:Uncharacterized protein n=1 Tax=Chiloscyllium punctatum TaxID=137246 RepID=A0A401T4Y2_CHIPU|nr:hypothetical protein [Chiloscyllium punctatum]
MIWKSIILQKSDLHSHEYVTKERNGNLNYLWSCWNNKRYLAADSTRSNTTSSVCDIPVCETCSLTSANQLHSFQLTS